MSLLINDILIEMKAEYGITLFELEKIADSQFKVLMDHIQSRDEREVHIKGIGKFKPSKTLLKYKNDKLYKESKEHNNRVQEPLV